MRNSKLFKFVLMSIMLCSASAAFASSASAWTTNGPLNFTATAPTALLNVAGVGISCTGANTATGTLNASGPATPFLAVSNLQLAFNGCTAAGIPANVVCQPNAQLWANSYSPGPPRIVTGEVRSISCNITVSALPGCKITVVSSGPNGRGVFVRYNLDTGQITVLNPTPPHPEQQTLTASWTIQCTMFATRPGSGAARFSASPAPNPLVYTVTSSPRPVITNP